MNWPTAQDYNEAIQNPRLCFCDHELKTGNVALGPFGLPRAISGNFASVYEVSSSGRRWAVRCFLREFADQQSRYAAIQSHLEKAHLSCTVGFEFLPRGVLVKGRWYPVLKMEWIDGIPLDVFIVKHLNDSTRLEQLAQAWMSMMAELKQGHVVHGDLQHGNILVGKDGRLRLIDYDGMFVPALRGLVSNEEGHRNYQHPQRTGRHFGPGIDSFSAWVIFISISALAVDPTLWKSLNGGDECLLFRRADFENPGRSKVLQAMEANPRPRLQALATQFRTVLSRSVENVPTLDGRPSQPVSRSSASPLPEWVADHIDRDASLTPLPADTDSRQTASAEWLFDHLVQRKPSLQVWASVDLRWERLGLVVVNLATWLVPVSFLLGPFVGLVGLALLMAMWAGFGVFLRVRYRRMAFQIQKRALETRARAVRTRLQQLDLLLERARNERSRLTEPLRHIRQEFEGVAKRLEQDLKSLDEALAEELNAMDALRRTVVQQELQANRECDGRTHTTALVQQRSSLDQQQAVELSQSLDTLRQMYVQETLANTSIASARINGVGDGIKARLKAAGIVSAANVQYGWVLQIRGVGPDKANAIMQWRRRVEQAAFGAAPRKPSAEKAANIQRKYSSMAETLDRQIESAKAQDAAERQAIGIRFERERKALTEREKATQASFDREASQVRTRLASQKEALTGDYRQMRARVMQARKASDGKTRKLENAIFKCRLALCQVNRDLEQFCDLTIRLYFCKIVGFGAAGSALRREPCSAGDVGPGTGVRRGRGIDAESTDSASNDSKRPVNWLLAASGRQVAGDWKGMQRVLLSR